MEWATIGLGEAGAALAGGIGARGYDRKLDGPARNAMLAVFEREQVAPCRSPHEALQGAGAVFSLVTADQALIAA